MKSWYHLSLLGFLAIFLNSCATPKSPSEIANQLDKSVVLISYPDQGGHGTGFFVPGDSDQCTVLTVRHVVNEQEVLKVKTSDDQTREVNQILPFKNQDLALLTFAPDEGNCPYPALSLGNSDTVKRAQLLFISGFYNNGGRLINHFVDGGVTAIDKLPEGYGIAYQAWTTRGMSGSPVVDTAGKVVAVHGRSDVEITKLAEIKGFQKPQLQALDDEEAPERGARIGTFKWGIPINLYLANIPETEVVATLSAKDYYDQGRELKDSEKYNEAIAAYDKAIELDPDYTYAWYSRGISLDDLERYEEAIASYDKALELDPDYTYAWYNRGISLGKLDRDEDALESYDKALELDPDYTYAWHGRGYSLGKLKRYEEAIASYDKAIELDPDYTYAWYGRGYSLDELERYEGAIASYDKALELDPDYTYAWYNRGISLRKLERYEEAIASYDKAIKLDPDYALAWNNKGYALELLERYDEALESYNKALELDPNHIKAKNNRKLLLEKMNQ